MYPPFTCAKNTQAWVRVKSKPETLHNRRSSEADVKLDTGRQPGARAGRGGELSFPRGAIEPNPPPSLRGTARFSESTCVLFFFLGGGGGLGLGTDMSSGLDGFCLSHLGPSNLSERSPMLRITPDAKLVPSLRAKLCIRKDLVSAGVPKEDGSAEARPKP